MRVFSILGTNESPVDASIDQRKPVQPARLISANDLAGIDDRAATSRRIAFVAICSPPSAYGRR